MANTSKNTKQGKGKGKAVSSPTAPSTPPVPAKAFSDILREVSGTYAAELKAQRGRLDELIGSDHWLSVGSYKEALLRRLLRNRVPHSCEVSTGFIIAQYGGKRMISDQIDVLIWNSATHSPLLRDGEFVIVPPEAVLAAIEVKGRLAQADLADALKNLERVTTFSRFVHEFGSARPPFRALFAFARKTKEESKTHYVSWPESVLNSLWDHYKTGDPDYPFSLADRIKDARGAIPGRWELPWIDMVCILGDGFIELEEWAVNGQKVPTYAAYDTAGSSDLSYNALEKTLLTKLLAPQGLSAHDRPGLISILVHEKGTRSSPPYMPLEKPPSVIKTIGSLLPADVAALAGKHHRPRGSGW